MLYTTNNLHQNNKIHKICKLFILQTLIYTNIVLLLIYSRDLFVTNTHLEVLYNC